MLTQRQSQLLNYITHFQLENGYSPSYAEMQEHMELASKSTVARIVDGLVRRGTIRKTLHGARSIEVLKPAVPEDAHTVTPEEHAFMKAARAYFRDNM